MLAFESLKFCFPAREREGGDWGEEKNDGVGSRCQTRYEISKKILVTRNNTRKV